MLSTRVQRRQLDARREEALPAEPLKPALVGALRPLLVKTRLRRVLPACPVLIRDPPQRTEDRADEHEDHQSLDGLERAALDIGDAHGRVDRPKGEEEEIGRKEPLDGVLVRISERARPGVEPPRDRNEQNRDDGVRLDDTVACGGPRRCRPG